MDFVNDDGGGIDPDAAMNRGFHEHGSARARHLDRLTQSDRRTGRIDDPIVGRGRKLLSRQSGLDARTPGNVELLFVPAVEMNLQPMDIQHLSDKQAQFAVTEYRHVRVLWNIRLIENLARRCERFDE